MLQFGTCPRCQTEIDKDRLSDGLVVCQACGWSDDQKSRDSLKVLDKKLIRLAAIGSVFLVLGFIHSVNWDVYFTEIIPLKVRQITGSASPADLERVAVICTERKNLQCVEEALRGLHQSQPQNADVALRYGRILQHKEQFAAAVAVYTPHFQGGGEDLDLAYEYAKALSALKRFDEAEQLYQMVLDAKPDTLQITVTQSFVDMLVEAGRLEQAGELIEEFQKKGDNTAYFLNQRLEEIKRLLAAR